MTAAATERTPAVVLDHVEQLDAAIRAHVANLAEIERLLIALKGPGPGSGNFHGDDDAPFLPNAFEPTVLGEALHAAVCDLEDCVGFGHSSPAWGQLLTTTSATVVVARCVVAAAAGLASEAVR